jgi:hypothetical protein
MAGAVWHKIANAEDASTDPDQILLDWEATLGLDPGVCYMYRISGVVLDTADSFITLAFDTGTSLTPPDAVITTDYDNTLLLKFFIGAQSSDHTRMFMGPVGIGMLIDFELITSGPLCMTLVEGAPFAGVYGGKSMSRDASRDYLWMTVAIAAAAV